MNKTKKMLKGVSKVAAASVFALSMAGCASSASQVAKPAPPKDSSCRDWDWNDDLGVYECDDTTSSYRGHYYYGGTYYNSSTALKGNSSYKSYSTSSNFAGKSSISGKSGIGSGSKGGFGG